MSPSKNILFLMSGSIAVEKATRLIKTLKEEGHTVKIACSETTFKFVRQGTLEDISGYPVISKNFQNELDMEHINLARWCDFALFCPATANSMNMLAQGRGDNIVGTLFLAYELKKKPFIIAPAMNTQMYNHPATQNTISILKSWGVDVLPTNFGSLACGEVGEGRLLEPREIKTYLEKRYIKNPEERKHVVITAGATRESIDGVRFITNFSSGKTGTAIANAFHKMGHKVTLIKSISSNAVFHGPDEAVFDSFDSLNKAIKTTVEENSVDIIIHTAAVSDYSIKNLIDENGTPLDLSNKNKLSSDVNYQIQLKKNFKILNKIKGYSSNKKIKIVAFKLTKNPSRDIQKQAIDKISKDSNVDLVIHNDYNEILAGRHVFNIYKNSEKVDEKDNTADLAFYIEDKATQATD